MFLKLNNDGFVIKGRLCTYGNKHREWIYKEDTKFPTLSTEGLILPFVIDFMEGQEVETAEIQGALLKTDYYKGYIHIRMEGERVNILYYIDPYYYKDFVYIDSAVENKCTKNTKRLYTAP